MSDREILFRGKHVDNGEWVEGFLSKSRGMNRQLQYCIDHEEQGVMLSSIIDFETLGQYTGLTDKNGIKIFEGDVVRQYSEGLDNEYLYDEYSSDIGRVFWYQGQARFLRTSKLFPDDCPTMCDYGEYEVIGNIHDNPELLEEREQE